MKTSEEDSEEDMGEKIYTSEEEDPEECLEEDNVESEEEDPEECPEDGIRSNFLKMIRQLNLPKFGGARRIAEAKGFLSQLEEKYHWYKCSPEEGVMMAVYSLEGNARLWWKVAWEFVEDCYGGDVWEQFRRAFIDEYLRQGNGTELIEVDSSGEKPEVRVKEIAGMIKVDGKPAYALFDTGATHSYVDETFAKEKGLVLRELRKKFSVTYADGSQSTSSHVCRGCRVVVGGVCTRAVLTVSKIKPLDVLIGMDWMGAYHAHIDCRKGEIEFRMPGRQTFMFRGDRGED